MYKKVTTARTTTQNGVNKWKLGKSVVGSWTGCPPHGSVYVRIGLLNLKTGEYSIYKPDTNIFN